MQLGIGFFYLQKALHFTCSPELGLQLILASIQFIQRI